ncbi:fluoride efflux transporter CrcB [Benzoatithermus flavus]|uniref:Fluoride-specific ion channel FluC n=1 Tax=Benzoatithermus flavus TaxID=3108223 RepID=A0ABU8XTP2_9PROT
MDPIPGYLAVFAGGGLGAALRHTVNRAAADLLGTTFPFGTLFVNVTGSLAMGLLAGWFAFRSAGSTQTLQLFLTTGILGGFTTFSAFSLDMAVLWERGHADLALGYAALSVLASLAGVFLGLWTIRVLTPA